ncbi:MAG: membrane protein insertion efficiency factor YidD [Actinomycetia bacterium]|nr:membrane protein insertion efficiency factor YidD [Actinomycetes bacterium]MCP4960819.1 membrane protein insertion efficiency factor YidD [Actinomycetes bacterium]
MSLAGRGLVALVRAYQKLPRMRPPVCRFDPTCSGYAVEAVERHGAIRGTWLAIKRVGKCHPWGPAGWDPVPERAEMSATINQHNRLGFSVEGKAD